MKTIDREFHPYKQFRVFDLNQNKIIYPQGISFYWTPNSYVAMVNETVDSKHFQISEDYVMQFTGLFDINEVEIFEGDICRFFVLMFEHGDQELTTGEIFWLPDTAGFVLDREGLYDIEQHNISGLEVIGNIWENEDMLKLEFRKGLMKAYEKK